MVREAGEIDQPLAAAIFALGCAGWAAKVGLGHALRHALSSDEAQDREAMAMNDLAFWQGRGLVLACAVVATSLGLVYLGVAGAPMSMLTVNLAALIAGLVIVLPFRAREPVTRPVAGVLAVLVGALLLLAGTLGDHASGARRWVVVGNLVVQPSLILLPFLVVCFARFRTGLTALGILLAAAALALQPDRAMAAALVVAVTAAFLARRDRLGGFCLAAAVIGFAVTMMRPDVVPATPFVDRVFLTAFSTDVVAGLAVWIGAAFALLPGVIGTVRGGAHRSTFAAFGGCWAAIVLAAIVGDYPTPLVAYSGSAILGYILATAGLPPAWGPSPAVDHAESVSATPRQGRNAQRVAVV